MQTRSSPARHVRKAWLLPVPGPLRAKHAVQENSRVTHLMYVKIVLLENIHLTSTCLVEMTEVVVHGQIMLTVPVPMSK